MRPSERLTQRLPVVIGPPADVAVLIVLSLQPFNERFEILHEWLGAHRGLACDHGHGLGPGLAETQLHHVSVGTSGASE